MKPGWRSSEFWLLSATVAFGMWAGGYALLYPELELERLLAVLAAVSALTGFYTHQRTSLKKEEAEAEEAKEVRIEAQAERAEVRDLVPLTKPPVKTK